MTKQLHSSNTESLFNGFEQQQQADGNPFIDIYEGLRKVIDFVQGIIQCEENRDTGNRRKLQVIRSGSIQQNY